MNPRTPPRLAILFLKWFGLSHDEPFAGDLTEEFRSGRSAGWFWRQTIAAIGAVLRRGVRRPEVRSLLVAYAIVTAAAARFLQIHGPVRVSLRSMLIAALVSGALNVLRYRFKAQEYGGRFLLEQWVDVIWGTGVMILVAGDIGSPLFIIGVNGLGLLGDLPDLISRSRPAARAD